MKTPTEALLELASADHRLSTVPAEDLVRVLVDVVIALAFRCNLTPQEILEGQWKVMLPEGEWRELLDADAAIRKDRGEGA